VCVRARARARVCVCVCVCVKSRKSLLIPSKTYRFFNIIVLKIFRLLIVINNDFRDSLFNHVVNLCMHVCMTYALYVPYNPAIFYWIATNHTKSPGHFGIRFILTPLINILCNYCSKLLPHNIVARSPKFQYRNSAWYILCIAWR